MASLPLLAEDLHAAALEPITQENFILYYFGAMAPESGFVGGRVNATSELYEPKIGSAVREIVACANKFTKTIGDLSLLEAESGGLLLYNEIG